MSGVLDLPIDLLGASARSGGRGRGHAHPEDAKAAPSLFVSSDSDGPMGMRGHEDDVGEDEHDGLNHPQALTPRKEGGQEEEQGFKYALTAEQKMGLRCVGRRRNRPQQRNPAQKQKGQTTTATKPASAREVSHDSSGSSGDDYAREEESDSTCVEVCLGEGDARDGEIGEAPFRLLPESDDGPEEYKLKLTTVAPSRLPQLVTQMKYRLSEGDGECYYWLGIEDDGTAKGITEREMEQSTEMLRNMASQLGARVTLVNLRSDCLTPNCLCARLQVQLVLETHDGLCRYSELRLTFCGALGAGKSTLLSVLAHGDGRGMPLLDNGAGEARSRVFGHPHEVASGLTSSISTRTIIYGKDSGILPLNYQLACMCSPRPPTPVEIAKRASKMVRCFDLGGHEKFLKTMAYGLTCMAPDYAALCVSASEGVRDMTVEHAALAKATHSPTFIVVTKCDTRVANQSAGDPFKGIGDLVRELERKVFADNEQSCDMVVIGTIEQALEVGRRFSRESRSSPLVCAQIVPIIVASSVTGEGIDMLHTFLKQLRPRRSSHRFMLKDPSHTYPCPRASLQVHKTFNVTGVGPVLFGTIMSGRVKVGMEMLLGPDEDGAFRPVQIKSIQRFHVPVQKLNVGQTGTLSFTYCDGNTDCDGGTESNSETINLDKAPSKVDASGGEKNWFFRSKSFPGRMAAMSSSSIFSYPANKKGTVLLDSQFNPSSSHYFSGLVTIPATIDAQSVLCKGGLVVVHCGSVRQTASVVLITKREDDEQQCYESQMVYPQMDNDSDVHDSTPRSEEAAPCGEPSMVRFKFVHWPEWLAKGSELVLRNPSGGRLVGVGFVC